MPQYKVIHHNNTKKNNFKYDSYMKTKTSLICHSRAEEKKNQPVISKKTHKAKSTLKNTK